MPSSTTTLSLLRPDDAEFIQQGISICVASRDVRHVPSLSRAFACRIADDGKLHLILARSHGMQLVNDLQKSAQIAVVFTQPSTHRTLQIKGSDARVSAPVPADIECLQRTETAFTRELATIGFAADFVRRLFTCERDDLCVVSFTPADVFLQTPGPQAGSRREPAA